MAPRTVSVLVQIREAVARRVADAVPDVELVPIPREGELPAGATGEVLLTLPWGSSNLPQALGPSRRVTGCTATRACG